MKTTMKMMLAAVMGITLAGCATDGIYTTSTSVYATNGNGSVIVRDGFRDPFWDRDPLWSRDPLWYGDRYRYYPHNPRFIPGYRPNDPRFVRPHRPHDNGPRRPKGPRHEHKR